MGQTLVDGGWWMAGLATGASLGPTAPTAPRAATAPVLRATRRAAGATAHRLPAVRGTHTSAQSVCPRRHYLRRRRCRHPQLEPCWCLRLATPSASISREPLARSTGATGPEWRPDCGPTCSALSPTVRRCYRDTRIPVQCTRTIYSLRRW